MARIARALLSVADKTGLPELAKSLIKHEIRLISTGGTAAALRGAGAAVTEVSKITGFPEIMDGRVKTLHPLIHGGLLGRPDIDSEVMARHGIESIDLVVINLYPFESTVARPNCTRADAIEKIDIGGPAMIRAAAKNHEYVAVLTDPSDYSAIVAELDLNSGELSVETRRRLAEKAFAHTACYDAAIWSYLSGQHTTSGLPERFPLALRKQTDLRYGENPHQRAALYRTAEAISGTLPVARQLQGKELSFNNIADADAALECVKALSSPACVIVKHGNPCGVGIASEASTAYEKAYATDPESAFGGVIAFNCSLDEQLARRIIDRQFVEVLIAPGLSTGTAAVLAAKPNVRVLETGPLPDASRPSLRLQQIEGGVLVQDKDVSGGEEVAAKIVTKRQPTAAEMQDALFAWRVIPFVKSNAIIYCRDGATLGIGAGQMSRVMSARIAAWKATEAKLDIRGSAMASDAFFPFRDGIDTAAINGISVVIQPGGSMRDEEVIRAADEHGLAMIFTGVRHFRH
jgi:phosphoribosylaminoimidazolecarboxamide formyltransferase/IMP cyclohydrolase